VAAKNGNRDIIDYWKTLGVTESRNDNGDTPTIVAIKHRPIDALLIGLVIRGFQIPVCNRYCHF